MGLDLTLAHRTRLVILNQETPVNRCLPAASSLALAAALLALPSFHATADSTLSSLSYQLHGGTIAAAAGTSISSSGTISHSGAHLGGLAAGASAGPDSGTQLVGGLIGSPVPIPEPDTSLLWLTGLLGLLALVRRPKVPSRFMLPSLAGILALALFAPVAAHAVPHDTAYQGRLTDELGDPLIGPAEIDFGLYESLTELPGEVALYSEEHDGVELDSDGSFNVLIGTGVVIVGSYDPSLFQGTNRYLQITINGETLEPRQPISSVPYAFVAEELDGAPDLVTQVQTIEGQIGSLPPGGTTIATHIADVEAALAVAEEAASTAQSSADTVAADLAVSDTVQAALIASLGSAPYASAVLKAGSFANLQVVDQGPGPLIAATSIPDGNWNQLLFIRCQDEHCLAPIQTEVAVGDFDPFGQCLFENMDGSCGFYGPVYYNLSDMSLAVGSDELPIMAYVNPLGSGSLSFIQCGNHDCNAGTYDWISGWSGNVKNYIGDGTDLLDNVLAVGGDGLPVIASRSGGDLIITHCDDLACSATSQVTVASALGTSTEFSMAIGSVGYPAFAYYHSIDDDLVFMRCLNPTCSATAVQVLDSTGDVGRAPALVIDSLGRPSIVYKDQTNGTLKFVRCLNISCTSSSAATVVLSGASSATSSDLIYTAAGDAVISYVQGGALSYLSCLDSSCSAADTTLIAASSVTAGSGRTTGMALDDSDDLVAAYIDGGGIKIYAQTGSRIDAILALIAAAQAAAAAAQGSADAAQASADTIVGSCGTFVAAATCPMGFADGPKCDAIPVGSFCEGDGECGTDINLNNCGTLDWYFRTGN